MVGKWLPNAVLCDETAAQLSYWPALCDQTVHLAGVRVRGKHPGFSVSQRLIPAELIRWRGDVRIFRRGNVDRRRLLLDSRSEPWSAAERLAHRVLRAAGIRGWVANYRVRCGGRTRYLDIAIPGLKLAIEIDGRIHQLDPALFEDDRARQNDLVLGGWRVLRFTWWMLVDDPAGVAQAIKTAIRQAEGGKSAARSQN